MDSSRLDGCRQTLDVDHVRPQTTRRQSVTETRSHGFDSLAAVDQFFENRYLLLAGWVHYLAFDLFVGVWEVREAYTIEGA